MEHSPKSYCLNPITRQAELAARPASIVKGVDGLVVREVDGARDARDTGFAPDRGTSYSFPFNGATRYDYREGAAVGAAATLTYDQVLGRRRFLRQ
jgi:hypothetical protein